MAIRILIVDDHAILRNGLALLIEGNPEMEVVGSAQNGREAVQQALKLRPDVILMDISMPVMDGIEATKIIKDHLPETEILILTMLDEWEYIEQVLDSGASGYVVKTYGEIELFDAIYSVYNRSPYLYPHAMKHLLNNRVRKTPAKSPVKREIGDPIALTDREREVLRLLALGYYNKEIAGDLGISVKTVEAHKSRVMAKLQLFTRHELVKYADNHGLLSIKYEGERNVHTRSD
ncbi:Oxygen regulatory protein NreC [compost metagenome]|nr:response regulator transcription factor [Paenibacillus timonensis]MUG86047.1 response regulator [Paenibacillus timonensis]